jgi:glucose/arabinose dehydrogenase
MTRRICLVFWIFFLLLMAGCGGAGGSDSQAPPPDGPSDWGEGMAYADCTEQGLTDYGRPTGQRWIGDFYADLYQCTDPAETLAPLQGLRYIPVFTDVRQTLGYEFAMPVHMAGRPGGEYTYLITREGRVWVVEDDTFSNPPVLDLRDSIMIGTETGLLGITLHPTDPRRMFLFYTDLQFDIIVAEYRLDETLRTAIPATAKTLLKIPTRSDFHKGGMLGFGPDGYLYIGLGDDGFASNGQDPTSLFASILRIDVDQGDPYAIPDDHPPVAEETPEVYLYGTRNPWRFWIDPPTNTIYIGDVGSDAFEEIDITSLDTPGANFGWSILEGHQWGPFKEGIDCSKNPDSCDTSSFVPPALALPHGADVCAIVGGVVYRGEAIPELDGHYFYSDVCGSFLRSFRWDGRLAMDLRDWTPDVGRLAQLLSFGVDTQGEMYVLAADGVFRIVPVR